MRKQQPRFYWSCSSWQLRLCMFNLCSHCVWLTISPPGTAVVHPSTCGQQQAAAGQARQRCQSRVWGALGWRRGCPSKVLMLFAFVCPCYELQLALSITPVCLSVCPSIHSPAWPTQTDQPSVFVPKSCDCNSTYTTGGNLINLKTLLGLLPSCAWRHWHRSHEHACIFLYLEINNFFK